MDYTEQSTLIGIRFGSSYYVLETSDTVGTVIDMFDEGSLVTRVEEMLQEEESSADESIRAMTAIEYMEFIELVWASMSDEEGNLFVDQDEEEISFSDHEPLEITTSGDETSHTMFDVLLDIDRGHLVSVNAPEYSSGQYCCNRPDELLPMAA